MKRHLSLKRLNQTGFDHVFLALAFVVVIGVVGTFALLESRAAAWRGAVEVYSQNSGYCLTANGQAEGDAVMLDPCTSPSNTDQTWSLVDTTKSASVQEFELQSASGSGSECLDNWQASKINGTQMRLYPCKPKGAAESFVWGVQYASQGFSPHQLGVVSGAVSGRSICVDDSGGSHATNAKVDIYTCKTSSQSNQNWYQNTAPKPPSGTTTTPSPGSGGTTSTAATWSGELEMRNFDDSLCMGNQGNSSAANTTVVTSNCSTSQENEWKFYKVASNTYTIKAATSNACVSSTSGEMNSKGRTIVATAACSSSATAAQEWEWENSELMNASTKTCINDPGNSKSSNTDLVLYSCSGTPHNAQWFEEKLGTV
jgi:hypothetical protein